jgi:chaperonin GroES
MAATATKKRTKVTLQPLGDKVVVERDTVEEKTAGGIYIPDAAKDKPSRGTIIAVGTGKLLDDGTRGKMQVKKGDRVLFTSYAPETIKLDDDELLLMSETDILAVIE